MNYDDLVRRLDYLQYDTCDCELCVKFRESRDAIQELQRDALRYRWLRHAGAWESELGIDELCENPDKFDAAVDEAMQHDPRG